jgi:hypothetical protein
MDSLERFSLRNSVGVSQLSRAEAADANRYIDAIVAVAYRGASRDRLDSLSAAFARRSWYFPAPGTEDPYWGFSKRIAAYAPLPHWQRVRVPVRIVFGRRR